MVIYLFEQGQAFVPSTIKDAKQYGSFNFDGRGFVWQNSGNGNTKGSLSGVVSELFSASYDEDGVLFCDRKSIRVLLRHYPRYFEYIITGPGSQQGE
ncbi:MAG: hypothetical protein AABX29_04740 [Nanoarchaeota archaeon]